MRTTIHKPGGVEQGTSGCTQQHDASSSHNNTKPVTSSILWPVGGDKQRHPFSRLRIHHHPAAIVLTSSEGCHLTELPLPLQGPWCCFETSGIEKPFTRAAGSRLCVDLVADEEEEGAVADVIWLSFFLRLFQRCWCPDGSLALKLASVAVTHRVEIGCCMRSTRCFLPPAQRTVLRHTTPILVTQSLPQVWGNE